MKKFYLSIILFVTLVGVTFSQVPNAINYQAVVRNASGEIISNQSVSFKISILKDSETGTKVYSETHTLSTNAFGLVNFKIGLGKNKSGTFSPVGWGVSPHFVKVEIDPAGGTAFSHLATSKLGSVPYAFIAQNVVNDKVNDADHDASNEIQQISLSGTTLQLSKGGGTVTLPSSGGGSADNWGTQTVVSNATLTGEGTTASPLAVVADGDGDDSNEIQTLTLSGNDLSLSDGGGSVTLPTGLWTESGSNIYRSAGKVGIGTSSPLHLMDISGSSATLGLKASSTNAIIYLDRKAPTQYAYILHRTNGSNNFYVGLLKDNNYKINYGSSSGLNGIEVKTTGDVNMSGDLKVDGEIHTANTGTANNMLPFAYGTVDLNANKSACTSNVGTVKRTGTGMYRIEIVRLGSAYNVMVTINNGSASMNAIVTAKNPTYFYVFTWDTKDDKYKSATFSFVVYKP